MKRFFINVGAKIGRFFWSLGFLKFVLWTITLVVLFYVEEDWRGARDWAATKAQWEAKGESFDYNKFIPPPVPDDQNLAALPLFEMEQVKSDDGTFYFSPVALQRAMRTNLPGNELPLWGNSQKGELPDMAKIRSTIAADYAEAFKGVPLPQSTLAQFEALYPFIVELRNASETRPFCRFAQDYTSQPVYARSLSLITAQIKVVRILALHAFLALSENKTETALADVKIIIQINLGVSDEPILVSGLVSCAITTINAIAINYGIVIRAWNDAQLTEIESALARIDPLADYQLVMRGEFIGFSLPMIEYLKEKRPKINNLFSFSDQPTPFYANESNFLFWPNGWLDRNSCRMADALLSAVSLTDPKAHRVFVDQAELELQEPYRFKEQWRAFAPWNILYSTTAGPILCATIKFARNQVILDQTRIACALERYRLTHQAYPDSLEALVPVEIDPLPKDPINGQAYHYKIRNDGTFLLYSIGWNQTDDGGVAVFAQKNYADPNDSPEKHGDWVWPTPQAAATK